MLLLIGVTSRYSDGLAWAEEQAVATFGAVHLKSEPFDFIETEYYQATMGVGLQKQFLTFQTLIDPGELPQIKHTTNEWELRGAAQMRVAEPRPLNLDPGYLTLAKLVLATTKDHAHRIYLAEGIYAEVTLNYRGGHWQECAWTYPDYQRADYQAFFTKCRQTLQAQRREATSQD
ncbi:MAG: DUF4416 family protein [Pirellulales bacterium]|nr:DUF4416 family protein [Pirellulales bacterium]